MMIVQLAKNIINNEMSARRTGRTTALLRACETLGGIFICHSMEFAKYIQKRHNVVTASVEKDLRGSQQPLFYDHTVVELLANALIHMERENKEMRKLLFEKQINDIIE